MDYSCLTDIGLIREKNQDSFAAIENGYGDFLALVCDGIGGGKAGEVASGETIKYFEEIFKESGPFSDLESVGSFIDYHIGAVNRHIYELAKDNREYEGMGTTLTGIIFTKSGIMSMNVGDSRVYGFKNRKAYHLTKDHTLVNQMISKGQITYEESLNHPKRHYLVKAIGIYDAVTPDINIVMDMEYYLVCSDGLHGYVSEEEIMEIVYDEERTIEERCEDLKDLALLKGGYDNITVVLIRMDGNV